MDRGLLRPAISGKSAQQKDRSRILGKCCFLHLAGGHSYCLYPKKPFAKAIRALQIARSRLPISLLCAAASLGIREPLERHCAQLFTARNHLPYCVYAMRWFLGGSDLPGLTVCSDCKGQCQVCHCHIKRNFWHRTYHQLVQRQRYGTGQQPVPDCFCDCGGLPAGHDFLSRRQPAALHPRPFRHQHPWYICQRCWSDYGNALTASRFPDCNYGCLYPDPDKNAPGKSKENTQMMTLYKKSIGGQKNEWSSQHYRPDEFLWTGVSYGKRSAFSKIIYRKEIRLPSINQRHFIQFILPCCQSTSHTG